MNDKPAQTRPYLITIFDSNGLYEIRCRGTIITSITHFTSDQGMSKNLTWDELEKDAQTKIIEKVKEQLYG